MKSDQFSADNIKRELETIFINHKGDRICVLGTICCGKTTLLKQLPNCVDADDELWPQLTKEEEEFICRAPWTEEIGDEVDRLVKEKVAIRPGFPLFGTVILESEVLVYLDIDSSLLLDHCRQRGACFEDALRIKQSIEEDLKSYKWQNSDKIYYYFLLKE